MLWNSLSPLFYATDPFRLNDAFERRAQLPEGEAKVRPAVDVYEGDDRIVLLADMPGAREDSIEVTLEERELTIRGSRVGQAPEGLQTLATETRSGDYERRFRLVEEIDADRIEATVQHGVLRLVLPKAEQKTRRIEIRKG